MFVISLMYGQPLVTIFGPSSCSLFLFSQAAHNWVFALGGLFMAIFRLYCIKFHFQTRDKKIFARNIRIAEIITLSLLCYSSKSVTLFFYVNLAWTWFHVWLKWFPWIWFFEILSENLVNFRVIFCETDEDM